MSSLQEIPVGETVYVKWCFKAMGPTSGDPQEFTGKVISHSDGETHLRDGRNINLHLPHCDAIMEVEQR